ncbi:hypothetical protein Pla123a_33690 [Posidoniimonas polymericola]|uniref:Cytochrome c domain-containing protein n=2 Tax=Posidoniimonas polymericola TaxID=2528002 RepID=A0A5C5YHU2_9BACT|nr:hypothetical protein Pla123a_33690 [Posidoniimonas polymericola]
MLLLAAVLALLVHGGACRAESDYDAAPIRYSSSAPEDVVAQLKSAVDEGVVRLEWDADHGWLPALLDYLAAPTDSQTLVFSKTSQQRRLISPDRPRALYFNDDVYLGWIPGAPLLEVSAVDPRLGAVFYTVDQTNHDRPDIQRDGGQCLACHATRQTEGVPGYLLRSVHPAVTGEPRLDLGGLASTPATPYSKRYGGWYVTARRDPLGHRGNSITRGDSLVPLAPSPLPTLDSVLATDRYLRPDSDLVALLVLEHQAHLHNLIARAGQETRRALHYNAALNDALDRPATHRSDSTRRRIDAAVRQLVRGLLMGGEPPLRGRVEGSGFAERYASEGPFDPAGRSLRQLDLRTRLFRYPCSPLVYSKAFDALPEEALASVRLQLAAALAESPAEGFEHLSAADRRAIREILTATKPGLLP